MCITVALGAAISDHPAPRIPTDQRVSQVDADIRWADIPTSISVIFGICNTIGGGRCPIRQGVEAGVPFP